jgi:hypothetical protein
VNSWDAEKDAGFQQFKSKNMELGNKAYDSNVAAMSVPGLADSSIGRQVAETGRSEYMNRIQDAIPDFVNQARNDYNQGIQNKYDQLNMLEGQANTEYGQWQNQQQMDRTARNDYTENTGYMPINAIPADDPLRGYSANYQLEINKRKAVNPNDPTIAVLEQLRAEKIAGNPALQKLYGTTMPMGMQTADSKQQGIDNQAAAVKAQQDAASNALDQAYKKKQIENIDFDNNINQEKLGISKSKAASSGSGTSSGGGKKLTPSQQDDQDYREFAAEYGNSDPLKVYSALTSGMIGLDPKSKAYALAKKDIQKNLYNKLLGDYKGRYTSFAKILNQQYYKDRLGLENYNKLIALADKEKGTTGTGKPTVGKK